jgi:hypothetical protein
MAASQPSEAAHNVVAFLAELIRLERQVRQLERQLDALEAGTRRALSDLASEVYEACR